jgi:hypothetical protein
MKPINTIFRKWDNGDIIALFPDVPHNRSYCLCYEHVGQHGGADYSGVFKCTAPATPEEYAPLKSELESIGYILNVMSRRYN